MISLARLFEIIVLINEISRKVGEENLLVSAETEVHRRRIQGIKYKI